MLVCIKNNSIGTHRIILMSNNKMCFFFFFNFLFIIIDCYPANDKGEEKLQGKLQCVSHILDV